MNSPMANDLLSKELGASHNGINFDEPIYDQNHHLKVNGDQAIQDEIVAVQKNQRFDRNGNPIIKRKDWPQFKQQLAKELSQQKEKEDTTGNIASNDTAGEGHKKKEKKPKFKVTFIDKIDKEAELATVFYMQSYKKYNAMNTFDPFEIEEGEGQSHCCTIF